MLLVGIACVALVLLTTAVHFEVLHALSVWLPAVHIRPRAKLLLAILVAFAAHAMEILLYALAIQILVVDLHVGSLGDGAHYTFSSALYFSAETYTSLGYGDVLPGGDLRLLAGVEALNGLLLIGWSASFIYIEMERYWNDVRPGGHGGGRRG